MVTMLMPSANASRDSKWSEWSTPVNLVAGINTPFVDASPAISQDGLTLYFNSNRPGVLPTLSVMATCMSRGASALTFPGTSP
jgi:WD40-like Beta Propeller Repeat